MEDPVWETLHDGQVVYMGHSPLEAYVAAEIWFAKEGMPLIDQDETKVIVRHGSDIHRDPRRPLEGQLRFGDLLGGCLTRDAGQMGALGVIRIPRKGGEHAGEMATCLVAHLRDQEGHHGLRVLGELFVDWDVCDRYLLPEDLERVTIFLGPGDDTGPPLPYQNC